MDQRILIEVTRHNVLSRAETRRFGQQLCDQTNERTPGCDAKLHQPPAALFDQPMLLATETKLMSSRLAKATPMSSRSSMWNDRLRELRKKPATDRPNPDRLAVVEYMAFLERIANGA